MAEIDAKLVAALERLGVALAADRRRRGRVGGVSGPQAQLLAYLAALRGDDRGVRDVARALGLSPASVSEAVAALEVKGLVRKRPSTRDRRRVVLELTPRGRAVARQAGAGLEAVRAALAELPAEAKAGAYRVVLEAIAALLRRGRIPYVRMCLNCLYFDGEASACRLLGLPLRPEDWRLDCPEHRSASAAR